MDIKRLCQRYCLDARSFAEKNARSMALAYERLLKGKTGQATRLFAYNHALNQDRKRASATASPVGSAKPAGKNPITTAATAAQKWKVRVWKNGKVVKTMTVNSDKEAILRPRVNALGIDWDKATIHDPKTMKQTSKFYNK